MDWQDRASCKGLDLDFFFIPEGSQKEVGFTPEIGTVRRMCADCEVQPECLEHALRHEEFGLWAGTSSRQRKQMRRERGIHMQRPELHVA